ncbi:MAG: peptidase S9 [Bacteroidetes bacterium]|nr:peptidase S9 [Bacteroidota bacterium]MDE2670969.1 peptidase S9 [Bacteroidota bacterium]
MRKFLLLAMLFVLPILLTSEPVLAQQFGRNKVQYDQFQFRSFRTPHFQFYYYPEEKAAVEDAARMGERWYRRHSRTFTRDFHERKPIIFYANDADFQQTNVIGGHLGQGTGGVTESLKERVVMPLTGIYKETDHVLGHELVHSFQYDIALSRGDSSRFALQLLPLWLVEGMAEYLSVGRDDAHTAMWMRDAALRDDLPTIEDLTRSNKYFPYRYGQAYLAYIGGKYGDAAVTNLFKLGGRTGVDSAFVYTIGITADSLSVEWAQAIRDAYMPIMDSRTHPDSAGTVILSEELSGGALNLSPTVSPDGQYVAYLSERDIFNINLFIADAETGETIRKLSATNTNPHFDNIRFINSAGSWSPDGKRFAFVTFSQGDNELSVWNLDSGSLENRISVEGVSAFSNPAWSPDGRSIAFSGIDGGISDLYIYDLQEGQVRQITSDRFADLQPAWSPDGQTLAVVTDRGPDGTNFETLEYAETRISLIDLSSGTHSTLRPFANGKHINPQFSPDGQSLYFISDQDGFSDIYRYDFREERPYRVTSLKTGVSGITALSPTMSVAAQNGRVVFSVYHDGGYKVFGLEADKAVGTFVENSASTSASILPPQSAENEGLVEHYLDDPLTGLPEPGTPIEEVYSSRLQLDYVAPPAFGFSVGGYYGGGAAGGVGFYFSDMLGNQNLAIVAQANGTFKDVGGMVQYMNRGRRFNYGGLAAHIPYLYGYPQQGFNQYGEYVIRDLRQRLYVDQIRGIGSYPLTTTRRFEVFGGFTRYGFDIQAFDYTYTAFGIQRERRNADKCSNLTEEEQQTVWACEPDGFYYVDVGVAYVGDFSNFGFTSPSQGGRYRFEVAPRIGTDNFISVLADYRRYFFPRPFTLAIRGMFAGNFGGDQGRVFSRESLYYPYYRGFVRGYNYNSFDFGEECRDAACSVYTRLFGTRAALASAEVRLPLLGTEVLGLINFPYLPLELVGFADVGMAWNEGDDPFKMLKFERDTVERVPVVSVGPAARFNLLGYLVFEIYYAYPFQRPQKGGHFGFQLLPGW